MRSNSSPPTSLLLKKHEVAVWIIHNKQRTGGIVASFYRGGEFLYVLTYPTPCSIRITDGSTLVTAA
jgi:hypothetical protein